LDASIPIVDTATARSGFVWVRRAAGFFLWCCLGLATVWAVAALYFDFRVLWLRVPLAAVYGLGLLAVWFRVRRPWKDIVTLIFFAVVLAWWLSLQPSNDRDWLPNQALLPHAVIENDKVIIHNIRNCDYRTETDYTVRHYDKTFDLGALRTVDLFVVYWGSPWIAHTMVSFGFEPGEQLCFSIETRNEVNESYSALKGFFRQFEITYVIADERDVVRLRTNYRKGENVHLYRTGMKPERARSLLLDYLRRANALSRRPEWYNAVTDNCTTNVRLHSDASRGRRSPFDWRILLNGKADEMIYERGGFVGDLPFTELKSQVLINERAKTADQDAEFSKRIRKGLPGFNH